MFFELILVISVGVCIGIVTGLVPGVHLNLVSIILFGLSPALLVYLSPLSLAVLIITIGILHSFLDAIPSIYLGAPEEESVLLVLPGHRLLLEGRGYDAVKLTVIGAFLSIFLTILFIIITLPLIPTLFAFLRPWMAYFLIAIVVYLILKDRDPEKIWWNAIGFFIAGSFGILVFSLPTLKQPLLAMLTGMFGISTLLYSLSQNSTIPPQKEKSTLSIDSAELLKTTTASVLFGSLTGIFPGISSSQAAVVAAQFFRSIRAEMFLVLVGGVGTVNFVFSLATLYSIEKARNGAIVVVKQLLDTVSAHTLAILLCTTVIAGAIAVIVTLWFARMFSRMVTRINYTAVSLCVIVFIFFLSWYFSGWLGILVTIVSTSIGILFTVKGIARNLAMGCLLLPVILYLL